MAVVFSTETLKTSLTVRSQVSFSGFGDSFGGVLDVLMPKKCFLLTGDAEARRVMMKRIPRVSSPLFFPCSTACSQPRPEHAKEATKKNKQVWQSYDNRCVVANHSRTL